MTTTSVFSHLTGKQFAEQILGSLERDLGVDLQPILADQSRTEAQRRLEASTRLLEALVERAEASDDRAEWVSEEEGDERTFLRAFAAGDVDIEPNLIYTEANVKTLKAMRGDDIKDYLYSLTKRFENMSKTTSPGILAAQIIGGGLVSISIPMAIGTVQALRAGSTLAVALRAGIANIGMKTAITAIVVALVGLLLWLMLENPKKFLGLVINDTDSHLVVNDWRKGTDGDKGADLYMKHGAMVSFPQDYEEGNLAKKIQINKRVWFGAGDKDNACYAGIFFASKNFGFRGAEGVAIYTATDGKGKFAHAFACPYGESNGTAVRVLNGAKPDVPALYDQLYAERKVHYETTSGGFNLVSTVHDDSGGLVGCITCFSKA
jgi:hypothetical protein